MLHTLCVWWEGYIKGNWQHIFKIFHVNSSCNLDASCQYRLIDSIHERETENNQQKKINSGCTEKIDNLKQEFVLNAQPRLKSKNNFSRLDHSVVKILWLGSRRGADAFHWRNAGNVREEEAKLYPSFFVSSVASIAQSKAHTVLSEEERPQGDGGMARKSPTSARF